MNHLIDCKDYFLRLQAQIVSALEQYESSTFLSDSWQREEGGGGLSRLIEHGDVFERAGVLFSHVHGSQLPSSATAQRPELAGRPWEAMGVSLVIHPKNPHVPTAHANVRVFYAKAQNPDEEDVYWFGGGMDLTPYYPKLENAVHFHRQCKAALDPFGDELYPNFKSWCDRYFYLKHRQETRGVGGIFFDDYKGSDFEQAFALTQSVGDHFIHAYLPIVESNYRHAYTEKQRDFQSYRRGRYVEFNLVYDRGTLFGLQSGGRTESILMSMPPNASWRYNWHPEAGSEEALLYEFLTPRDWLNE